MISSLVLNNLEQRNPTFKNIKLGAKNSREASNRPQTGKFIISPCVMRLRDELLIFAMSSSRNAEQETGEL